MEMELKFIPGEGLDKSFFYASDGKDEWAVRASSQLSQGMRKLASENKLALQPEDMLGMFKRYCSTVEQFKALTVRMAAQNEEEAPVAEPQAEAAPAAAAAAPAAEATPVAASQIVQAASKEDVPTQATEPVSPQKAQVTPVVAAEAPMTVKPEGSVPAGDTRSLLSKLPSKSAGNDAEFAWDIKSSADVEKVLHRMAEELKQKDEALKKSEDEKGALKGELDGKKKEEALSEVMSVLKSLGVDTKAIEPIKPELMKLTETAIGAVVKLLKLIEKVEEDEGEGEGKPKKPAGPPMGLPGGAPKAPGSVPAFLQKGASQDDLVRAASNLPPLGLPSDGGNSLADLANSWISLDRVKESSQVPV
jgi:hypothetical protein